MEKSRKELESMLLLENKEELEKSINLFCLDNKEIWNEIFNIFFAIVLTDNLLEINLILDNIEVIIFNDNKRDYKTLIYIIRNIIYKFSDLKSVNSSELKNIKFRLLAIIRKLQEKSTKVEKYNLYDLYYSIIFEEKDLTVIKTILKQEKNILGRKDKNNRDLFYNILDYYSSLEENNIEEIEYFYNVIMLFFEAEENFLVRNWKEYSALLEREFCIERGHVKEIIRKLHEIENIDIIKLKKQYDISSRIHDDAIREISNFEFDDNGRKRINHSFITIDGEGSSCLDDALCMVKNKDGSYYFYVGIVDIPSLIPFESRTFYDALRKVETMYLLDDVIDLYHPIISHDLCSLLPRKDKHAIVYKYFVDPNFNLDLDSLEIIKGIIRTSNRLTYSEVNKGLGISLEEARMIENMYFLALGLKNQNKKKEKYRQIENLLYADALYHHSLFTDKSISANIIQESMLLVNSSAARYFKKNGLIYTYRNHKLPRDHEIDKKIAELLKIKKTDSNSTISKQVSDNIKQVYLNAYYSTENKGHEGLGYDFYSHSTSSARRFDDSFNQYLTYFQVFNSINDREYYELEMIAKEIVEYINQRKLENSRFASEYNYLRSRGKILKIK